jgi:membrane protein implicated in regulation of membrane protease activity
MTGLEIFFLACFFIGLILSVISFLTGSFHLSHVHVPHVHVHVPDAGHIATPHAAGGAHAAGGDAQMPFFNFGTITAFLTWFGGTGYLLTRYSTLVLSLIMMIAIAVGMVGAWIVFLFIAKLLMKHDRELDPADYERVGVLGRITSPIREGGTGEMIFSQEGTRHTCGARSECGGALEKGAEVIITRYEKGIAYVRRWEEMAEETATSN